MRYRNDITAEFVRSILDYDPKTGEFRWRWRDSAIEMWNIDNAGNKAGITTSKGYIRIKIAKAQYMAHRLAWLYVNGEWPIDQIDHRNGVKSDNSIKNIRQANNIQNKQNSPARIDNCIGLKGVHLHKSGKWRSQICINGIVKYLGLFSTPENAHSAYCEEARKNFGEFSRSA